jgi:hypothetical protein
MMVLMRILNSLRRCVGRSTRKISKKLKDLERRTDEKGKEF